MYCTGAVHFANRHACVTFWTHSCPATGNSKPDSPKQPACERNVTSGLQSVRLCRASASWCWINGWNVRQKLNLCLLRRHDHTKVTWSPLVTVHDFIFHLTMTSLTHFEDIVNNEDGSTCTRRARARDSKHQSNHRRIQSQQQAVKLMWRFKAILNWYDGA